MTNPQMDKDRQKAINVAISTSKALHNLFGRMGTREHPRGRILTAYRQARKALEGNLDEWWYVSGTLQVLRVEVENAIRAMLQEATGMGRADAEKQLAIYGLALPFLPGEVITGQDVEDIVSAVLAVIDSQIARVRAAMLFDDAEYLVLGDASRLGILQPSHATREASKQAAGVVGMVWGRTITGALGRAGERSEDWARRAVAVLDECTTDCCRRVDGQVVGLKQPFHLTGTPRYADYMMDRPFHDW